MNEKKKFFLDKELRTGGYYELAIQVCPVENIEPIRKYTDHIWSLENVDGPFDINYNPISIDPENIEHCGILHFDKLTIPFKTINIREDEPIESGFNWFDICFYTSAIEKVFGSEYQTWAESPKLPKPLEDFFMTTIKDLYKLYHFELAIIDFEVSGQYFLEDLKKDLLNNWTTSRFYVGKENYTNVAVNNRKFVSVIED